MSSVIVARCGSQSLNSCDSTQVYIQQRGEHVVVRVGGGYKSLQALKTPYFVLFSKVNVWKTLKKMFFSRSSWMRGRPKLARRPVC